jgi:hypothetical protein
MANLATVEPDRVGIVNGQCEDVRLWKHSISTMLSRTFCRDSLILHLWLGKTR